METNLVGVNDKGDCTSSWRWLALSETSPSGKQLFRCLDCGRISLAPDKRCRPKPTARQALDNLADAFVEDILNASDEEILEEFREDGLDPEQHAAEMRALLERAVKAANLRTPLAPPAGIGYQVSSIGYENTPPAAPRVGDDDKEG